jgi:hypothetical protein
MLNFKPMAYAKNDIIVKKGHIPIGIFFIFDGSVKITYKNFNEELLTLRKG